MCGIVGIFGYRAGSGAVDQDELDRIRDHMAARGPDGMGSWYAPDGRVGLGHRRLSVIDVTTTGKQPMVGARGTHVVTFNGEIYNHRELRAGLEARGRIFESRSDTEVLLHLYAEKGEAMLADLRGMFSFGLWDSERNRLLLARDPFGIKPLYVADDGRTLRFASQVKALMAGGAISREIDPAAKVGFYLTGSIPEPFTVYRAITAVPAGSYVIVDANGVGAPHRYFNLAEVYARAEAAPAPIEPAIDIARRAMLDSVRHHLVADVPVGAFLSAGIDSSALVGLMRDINNIEIDAVTMAFDEFGHTNQDEGPLAAEIAKLYGVRHTRRVVTAEEFCADLPRILDAMDQPSIDGVNTWFVAKATKELGLKVAISGLGGDELFGGYPSFRDVPRMVRWLSVPSRIPFAANASRRVINMFGPERFGANPKVSGLLEFGGSTAGAYLLRRGLFMTWELGRLLEPGVIAEGLGRLDIFARIEASLSPAPRSDFAKVAILESSHYMRNQLLRDADWASMAHGVEVRLPLVDARLVEQLAPITVRSQPNTGKALLAKCPTVPLPHSVALRAKSGFMTPIDEWQQRYVDHGNSPLPAFIARNAPWARRWAYTVASSQF